VSVSQINTLQTGFRQYMAIKILDKIQDYIKPANDMILDGYKNTQLKIPLQTKD
jgi:hypothetical protein